MAWTVLCIIRKVITSNTNLWYKVMGAQKTTQGAKKSEVFQKENIGHAYFGESGEMGLKKDVKQCLSIAVPLSTWNDFRFISHLPSKAPTLARNKPSSVTGVVRCSVCHFCNNPVLNLLNNQGSSCCPPLQ